MMIVLSVTMACVRLFTAVSRAASMRIISTELSADLGRAFAWPASTARAALSVERIAFAVLMPELTIGPVRFDNGLALCLQKARETCSKRSGPLDAKGMDHAERSRPRFEVLITLRAYGDWRTYDGPLYH